MNDRGYAQVLLIFAYQFDGDVDDLKIEAIDGVGFVKLPIDELEKRLDAEPDTFATVLTDTVGRDLLRGIKNLLR